MGDICDLAIISNAYFAVTVHLLHLPRNYIVFWELVYVDSWLRCIQEMMMDCVIQEVSLGSHFVSERWEIRYETKGSRSQPTAQPNIGPDIHKYLSPIWQAATDHK